MKQFNKHILEAIYRGINLALDDFDDELVGQQTLTIKDTHYTKELLDIMNMTVDLGLPSDTLWCKYNLGCNIDLLNNHVEDTKAEDWFGGYYAWGELEPNKHFSKESYKFIKETLSKGEYNYKEYYINYLDITKYNYMDGLYNLQLEDDAAYLNLHCNQHKFNIPTKELFEELFKYTTISSIYISDNGTSYNNIKGLYGILLKSKINGNELFIPFAGYYHLDSPCYIYESAYLWTLRRSDDLMCGSAYHLTGYVHKEIRLPRYQGLTIRAVTKLN